jgi:hypothetical protein
MTIPAIVHLSCHAGAVAQIDHNLFPLPAIPLVGAMLSVAGVGAAVQERSASEGLISKSKQLGPGQTIISPFRILKAD